MQLNRVTNLWPPFTDTSAQTEFRAPYHYHNIAGPKAGEYELRGQPDRNLTLEAAYHVVQGSN